MSTTDRRTLIAEAAVDLIATAGLRALTHRALDTALDLPAGSTSYYFRTRRALLDAVADHLTERSRADFLATAAPRDLTAETVARDVADRLDRMLTTRRHHLIARQALLVDPLPEPDLRARLARSLFSPERATDLFRALGGDEPAPLAADFLAVLEGAVLTELSAAPEDRPARLRRLLSAYLRGAIAP